jgi:threonine/homoserine/homoserine lactone efflux protein
MDNNLGLMERFANPELFEGLTFAEKMAGGAVTLLMGMGITFIVLMILWGCIAAALFTFVGRLIDTTLLRKCFGGLLLITGLRELFYRPRNAK